MKVDAQHTDRAHTSVFVFQRLRRTGKVFNGDRLGQSLSDVAAPATAHLCNVNRSSDGRTPGDQLDGAISFFHGHHHRSNVRVKRFLPDEDDTSFCHVDRLFLGEGVNKD